MELELRELELRYGQGGPPLLSIERLVVPAGQRVLLRGASGAGKSSLLHALSGLTLPRSGDVRVGDTWLGKATPSERLALRRQKIGFVFQRLNIMEHLTAAENVELGAPGQRLSKATVLEALSKVGLADRARDQAWTFSLGEQQRVAVARVLATRPQLIVADEPTSSLDDANAARTIDALLQAADGAVTVLVATHDARIADRFERHWRVEDGTVHDAIAATEAAVAT